MRLPLVVLLLALAACSTSGTLDYVPTASVAAGAPAAVSSLTVDDVRNEKPNRLATIRGGFGNPLNVLDTPVPVRDVVAAAFTRALAARNIALRPGASRKLVVVLRMLEGDQHMGRTAKIDVDLLVQDLAGKTLYEDSVTDSKHQFTFLDNGAFASLETLRQDVQALLNRTIDRLLDKPAFRQAIASPIG